MPNSDKTRRKEAEKLRRIYWFEGVRIAMNAPSAYALEKKFSPEAFRRSDEGIPYHSNKWNGYKHGLHTPHDSVIDHVNQFAKGSRKEIKHVLWSILASNSDGPEKWLKEIGPELQMIVIDNDDAVCNSGARYLGKIERRASLDALACLTVLLKISLNNRDNAAGWKIALSICRVLLMLGSHFISRKIADQIFAFYEKYFFCKVAWDGQAFRLGSFQYSLRAKILDIFSKICISKETSNLTWNERARTMYRIFNGDFGYDLFHALSPLIGPDLSIGPPTEIHLNKYQKRIQLQNWGMENLASGGSERFPPCSML